ncbi:MAG: DUF885 domain-containing protein [Alphaproteobacteria bacterium]|nr:DUF885 domain-containing protein [Alphaproteobacteria bacterium]
MSAYKLTLFAGAAALAVALAGCGKKDDAAETSAADTQPPVAEETVIANPDAALLEMAAAHAAEVLKAAPEFATILGVSEEIAGEGYNARLGKYGFAASDEARHMNERFLQDIRGLDRDALGTQARITYDVLRDAYETGARRNQFEFGGATPWGSASPYVITQLTGAHLFLPRLLQTQQPLATKADAEAYLARLAEFGRVFDEVIESLGGDAALGVVPPYFAINGAVGSIKGFTSSEPGANPLATTFAAKLGEIEELSEDERNALNQRAVEAVDTVVYPAYARLAAALENLTEQAGREAGVWRLGDVGAEFYQHALDAYGAGGRTGDDIHALGLSEVARITAEMEAIFQAEGVTGGSVAERFEAIGARADMRYPNTDEGRAALLASLKGQVEAVMAVAPHWFGTIPKQSIEVRRIPVYEQNSAPGGYYTSPALDGSRGGVYWINLKDTADWPKHTLKTLTYHEAVPGHHFQISLEQSASLPLIRNMLGYSEFSEGWALYAEQVAAEMGMYEDDPLGNLSRLQSELFRAARLVVDSGLHHKHWTREQSIDYMQSVTGDTRASVTREIERYAVWPGQATSYKLGMLKINELRKKAEAELGDSFDIRKFHDEILMTGSMPLPVLEKKIDGWVAAKKSE